MAEKKTRTYKQPYSPEEEGNGMTLTGFTSRQLYSMEQAEQRAVAEDETWHLAREVNTRELGADQDSRSGLEALGFRIVGPADDLFYIVIPPAGWTRETNDYWTSVKDEEGKERLSMFYKGAIYDRRAFLNFEA